MMKPYREHSFASVGGTIVEMRPDDGCVSFFTVEDDDGNTVTFVVTPDTFVVDWETLQVGGRYLFWYRTDEPAPLIYPPQYRAFAAARIRNDRMVDVSFYNDELINEEQTLQLNLDGSVKLRCRNNQYFHGSPQNHDLAVIYENSTRSIPAQTTPRMVIVLCAAVPEDDV